MATTAFLGMFIFCLIFCLVSGLSLNRFRSTPLYTSSTLFGFAPKLITYFFVALLITIIFCAVLIICFPMRLSFRVSSVFHGGLYWMNVLCWVRMNGFWYFFAVLAAMYEDM